MTSTRRFTFASELDARAEDVPDRVFLWIDETPLTYSDAEHQAWSAANSLADLGVKPGETIAMLTANCVEWVAVWIGAPQVGVVTMPINVMFRGEFLRHQLTDSGAVLIVVDRAFVPQLAEVANKLPALRTVVVRDFEREDEPVELPGFEVLPGSVLATGAARAPAPTAGLSWNDPACLFYTSGTTGPSKGAVLTQHYMCACADALSERYQMTSNDVVYGAVPLFHVSGAQGIVLGSLVSGRTSVLDSAFSVTNCWDRVREHNASVFFGVGAMVMMLWTLPPDPAEAALPFRLMIAVPIPAEMHRAVEERYGCTLVQAYGLTEAMLIASHAIGEDNPPGSAGTPGPLYEVRLLDDDDQEVAVGVAGEIAIRPRSPHVMFEGYLNRPEQTLAQVGNLWFHTGDYGRFDETGNLWFVDRKKDAIRRRGENISSFEVERAVMTHGAVLECAAHAVPSELGEDEVKICVVIAPETSLDPAELVAFCEAKMPSFAVPRYVEIVDALPKNAVGRVQKHVLREQPLTASTWDREARVGGAVTDEIHDYVVIGGGSSGSVVAGRLADRGADVLVLEAGGTDRRPDVYVPAGVVSVYRSCNWKYVPEPDPSRGGVAEAWAAGRILGGGGSINATVFVRGNKADYDGWAKRGATGWDYDSVLPYFRRMETWAGGADEYRGGAGPIHVGFHTMDHVGNDAFVAAARQAGHDHLDDYNGARQEGVGIVQVNQRRGTRSQSSREYLHGAHGRRLRVRTHAFVQRILFEGGRAVGVEYERRGQRHIARVRHEVVLSAGSLASPKILMLSGVGPGDELARMGIPVVHDSPGVGGNLQEHPAMMQRWHATVPTINSIGPGDAARAVYRYARHRTGALAATVFHVQVMHRTRADLDCPDIQLAFANFATVRETDADGILKVKPSRDQGFLVSTLFLHPRTRGRLRLRSASPADRPVIEHELIGNDEDRRDLLAGMEEGRRIMAQSAMADLIADRFEPERDCRTPDDWEQLVRREVTYGAHAVGTCRMGVDETAVVDPELRVHGVTGLRVVDASVMPTVTTGNTNAPSMMIGERATDLIAGN